MHKHAYMIIAHNEFELLEYLVKALDDERNDIYIHIDSKVKDFNFDKFKSLVKYSSIHFTNRISITWGDFSVVKCEMLLLRTAYENEDLKNPYSYFHLLSGVDLPVKSNDEIYSFFEENNGKEFIHYSSNTAESKDEDRIKYYHLFRKKRNMPNKIMANIAFRIQKHLPVNRLKGKNITVRKGCNWFSITHNLAEYILGRENEINKMFNYSYCSDELFLQTIVENSDFKNNLFMDNCNNNHYACARLIDWKRGNPYVFRKEDYELLISSKCMFARKFSMKTDKDIIQMIISHISKGETV